MLLSRPTKRRRVCRFPETLECSAMGETTGEPVILTVDKYEAIRLIDKEGLSQEACGTQPGTVCGYEHKTEGHLPDGF